MRNPVQSEYIFGASALKTPQQHPFPRIERLGEQIRKAMRVAKPKVDPLAGERVHDMGRVPDQRDPLLRDPTGNHPTQRKRRRRSERVQIAQGSRAGFAHAYAERLRWQSEQLARVRLRCRPHNGHAPLRQRQKSEHAVPEKPLMGDTAMRPGAGEIGDHAELAAESSSTSRRSSPNGKGT